MSIFKKSDHRPHPYPCMLFLVALLLTSQISAVCGQARRGPDLPPGVRLQAQLAAASSLPPNVLIDGLDVDWTHTELRATLEVPRDSTEGTPTWQGAASRNPEALMIQLSVPDPEGKGLTLAVEELDREISVEDAGPVNIEHLAPVRPGGGDRDNRVHIGGILAWTFTGPGTQAHPGWNGALAGETCVALRWLGTANDWIMDPPTARFTDRVLISSLNPVTGQGCFYLVRNRTGRPLHPSALTGWVRDAIPGAHLIAIHASGRDVEIGQGKWRMGGSGGSGDQSRAGAVLVLQARRPDERGDLARYRDVQLSASSYEFAYPPSQTISGRLWPVALRPPVWMARKPGERAEGPDWFDLELQTDAAVSEIRLVHAGAAGWSPQFNSRKLRIEIRSGREIAPVHDFTFRPSQTVSVLKFPNSLALRGLRIHFETPGNFDLPAVASLMAVQVLGKPPQ